MENQKSKSPSITEFLSGLNDMANTTTDVDEGLRGFLKSVCEYCNWPVGHAYLLHPEADALVSSRQWFLAQDKDFSGFVAVSEQATFKSGIGLPGRVLENGKPAWILNVMTDSNFPRNKQAKDLGVKGAFAIPIKIGAETVAVAEFFAEEEAQATEMLIGLILTAASQMARVIERDRRTQSISNLIAHFEKSVLGVVEGVHSATDQLTSMASTMHSLAENANSSVGRIAQTASQTSSNVSSMADATHELTNAIDELQSRTDTTANKVNHAATNSENAKQLLSQLHGAASAITQVREEIQALAKQTQMVSLNARIEAARAGGQIGQAFAVVAREVQDLAKATSVQNDQIGDRINAINEATDNVHASVDLIHTEIDAIQELADFNKQSLSSQQQASNAINGDAQDAAKGTAEVSKEVETIVSALDQTSETAGSVDKASQKVADDVAAIREELDKFLSEIKRLV